MLRSDLFDFNDAYIAVKGTIILTKDADRNFIYVRNRFLAFENNAPLTNWISKINSVLIHNAEDLDVIMPIHNLIAYNRNYRKTTSSSWNYYRDEANNPSLNPSAGNNPPTVNYNADPITNSVSLKYKTSNRGKTSNANQENGENTEQENTKTQKNIETVVPLKHLSNFGKILDMNLINCEVSLTLNWSESCILTELQHKQQEMLILTLILLWKQ